MKKIGITGQSGFIGTHLFNTLNLQKEVFQTIPFEDVFFNDEEKLNHWVSQCDVIVHLAALNRHNEPHIIYDTNIRLVKQLIAACKETNSKPHIIFSSSKQEERDNLYGRSKKEGREILIEWARRNNSQFTGLIIPNVFGPFGHPYYNSVVATFCHQLTHGESPKIETDAEMKLIYVGELVKEIISVAICNSLSVSNIEEVKQKNDTDSIIKETFIIPHTSVMKVSGLLKKIQDYKIAYFEKGEIPPLNNTFERNLFNTFLCYLDHKTFFPFILKKNTDNRGSFIETIKLNSGGQVSFSTTVPDITRGNHFHIRKAERFAVIKGKALIELRKVGTDKVMSFELDGETPSFVDMPIWYTHNIKNIGNEELYTIFWISEHFDASDPDTFFEKV